MTRPNWGHGPNQPVSVFSPEEIAAAMYNHYPVAAVEYGDNGAEAFCECGFRPPSDWPLAHQDWRRTYIAFNADHLVAELLAQRQRAQDDAAWLRIATGSSR